MPVDWPTIFTKHRIIQAVLLPHFAYITLLMIDEPSPNASSSRRLTPVRVIVLLVILSTIGPLIYITSRASGITTAISLAIMASTIALSLPFALKLLPDSLPNHRSGFRLMFSIWVVLGLAASYRVVSLGVFMLDAEDTAYAVATDPRPFDDEKLNKPFSPKHNCFTSYMIGLELAVDGDENIYEPKKYRGADGSTNVHQKVKDILNVDTYQYPPTFLLLPRAVMLLTDSFFQSRTYWFTLNLIVFSLTVAVIGYWIGGRTFNAFWLAWPLVAIAPTTLLTLQIGNVHFLIISLSLLGMVMLEKRHYKLGGLILGYVIVAKIFPGVLLLYLILRRQWRSVAWTLAAMSMYVIATWLIFGPAPWQAFIEYQLPRLSSGDAFGFARDNLKAIAVNSSLMGMLYKFVQLDMLQQETANMLAAPVMWVFTAILLTLIVVISLAHRRMTSPHQSDNDPQDQSILRQTLVTSWLVIIILAQMRSPFLPWTYGNIAILWLLALLIPTVKRWRFRTLFIAFFWVIIAIDLPLPYGPGTLTPDLIYGLVGTTMVISLCLGMVCSLRRSSKQGQIRPINERD